MHVSYNIAVIQYAKLPHMTGFYLEIIGWEGSSGEVTARDDRVAGGPGFSPEIFEFQIARDAI